MFRRIRHNRVILALLICYMIIIIGLSGCGTPIAEKAPPVAQISPTSVTIRLGESITLSAAGSTDSDGSITSYQWDFGDGNVAFGVTVDHLYLVPGAFIVKFYNVKLTVMDDDGLSDADEIRVTVYHPE